MKKLLFICVVLLTVAMPSYGNGYDLAKIDEFMKKDVQDVSDDEYADMVDQAIELGSFLQDKFENAIKLKTEIEFNKYLKPYQIENIEYNALYSVLMVSSINSDEKGKAFKKLEDVHTKWQERRLDLAKKCPFL